MSAGEQWISVARVADFGASRKLVREVGGLSILLCRLGSDVVAVLNVCTHLGHPLDGGRLMAGQIHCPFHGACFDLRDGRAVSGPAVFPLRRFPVRVQEGEIFLDMGAKPAG